MKLAEEFTYFVSYEWKERGNIFLGDSIVIAPGKVNEAAHLERLRKFIAIRLFEEQGIRPEGAISIRCLTRID